jgi:hypothetical protein
LGTYYVKRENEKMEYRIFGAGIGFLPDGIGMIAVLVLRTTLVPD